VCGAGKRAIEVVIAALSVRERFSTGRRTRWRSEFMRYTLIVRLLGLAAAIALLAAPGAGAAAQAATRDRPELAEQLHAS
jgi:hypothetical protein